MLPARLNVVITPWAGKVSARPVLTRSLHSARMILSDVLPQLHCPSLASVESSVLKHVLFLQKSGPASTNARDSWDGGTLLGTPFGTGGGPKMGWRTTKPSLRSTSSACAAISAWLTPRRSPLVHATRRPRVVEALRRRRAAATSAAELLQREAQYANPARQFSRGAMSPTPGRTSLHS